MANQFNSIVTGGLQGIGRVIAEKLLHRGDRVFVFDYLPADDPKVLKLLENFSNRSYPSTGSGRTDFSCKINSFAPSLSEGVNGCASKPITYIQVDVACAESVKNGFAQLFQILDSTKSNLDILINNAGITRDGLALRMNEHDWDSVLDVNLKGAFLCCQQAIKRMIRQEKSYIINMSSVVGKTGNIGQANYAASKAGLIAITKSLAQEYGSRNILVNAIAPGFILTDMTQKLPENVKSEILKRISLKRFGTSEDVANLVDFLTGGRADYITGSVLDLNGGLF